MEIILKNTFTINNFKAIAILFLFAFKLSNSYSSECKIEKELIGLLKDQVSLSEDEIGLLKQNNKSTLANSSFSLYSHVLMSTLFLKAKNATYLLPSISISGAGHSAVGGFNFYASADQIKNLEVLVKRAHENIELTEEIISSGNCQRQFKDGSKNNSKHLKLIQNKKMLAGLLRLSTILKGDIEKSDEYVQLNTHSIKVLSSIFIQLKYREAADEELLNEIISPSLSISLKEARALLDVIEDAVRKLSQQQEYLMFLIESENL